VDHQTHPLEYLQYQLKLRFGRRDESYGYSAANGGALGFNLNGTMAEVQSFVDALTSSGLVESVVVTYRKIPNGPSSIYRR
jgi:hypothetical protein